MSTILLTGATGTVSSATIAALRGSGHKLIGLVRNRAKAEALGIELREGDLEKPRSLEGAFDGVDTAWLLSPPGPLAPYQQSNAIWAAKQAGVKHVVRLSAVGAAYNAPTVNSRLHALSDAELAASGVPYTLLKPHFFMQNLLMGAKAVAEQGVLYFALGDASLPMIHVADVAAVAAKVLSDPAAHAGKTYTLTGGASVSLEQAAGALRDVLGKPVKYVPVPVAATVEMVAKMGLDDYTQVALRDYFTMYSQGWSSEVTGDVQALTGAAPRTVADFAREAAGAFGER